MMIEFMVSCIEWLPQNEPFKNLSSKPNGTCVFYSQKLHNTITLGGKSQTHF